jgi:hypothetical protein
MREKAFALIGLLLFAFPADAQRYRPSAPV